MKTPLPHNPFNGNTRPGRILAMIIFVAAVMLGISAASDGDARLASAAYLYPQQLSYGVLNTLRGVDRTDAQVAIEMNFDRLSNSIDPEFKVTLDFLPDTTTAAGLIRQRKLHALSITGIDYFRLSKLVTIKPLSVASKLLESPIEPYVLLAPKSITLEKLSTKAQRRLILESTHQWDIGRIWLETVLDEKGLPDSHRFFTSIQVAAKPIRMVLPVFFGQADVCLVPKSAFDTMVELNPQIGQKLHVLLRSPGFVKNLICVADYLDPKFVEKMQAAIIDMHDREAGRQMLIIFQLRRNFPFRPEYLIDTESVFQKYEKLNLAR